MAVLLSLPFLRNQSLGQNRKLFVANCQILVHFDLWVAMAFVGFHCTEKLFFVAFGSRAKGFKSKNLQPSRSLNGVQLNFRELSCLANESMK